MRSWGLVILLVIVWLLLFCLEACLMPRRHLIGENDADSPGGDRFLSPVGADRDPNLAAQERLRQGDH